MPNQPFSNQFNLPLDSDGFCLALEGPRKGRRICGAKKNSGKPGPCLAKPMPNGRCIKHGGGSPTGISSARYRGHGYSKYLPDGLAKQFQDSLADPGLIELRRDVALVEAQMKQTLERLSNTGAGMRAWKEARAALREMLAAMQLKPATDDVREAQLIAQKQAEAVVNLQTLLEQGSREASLFEDLARLIDQKRRLVDSEVKREVNARNFVSIGAISLLYDALAQAVIAHVQDRATLAAIQSTWNGLVNRASQPAIQSGDITASNEPDDGLDPDSGIEGRFAGDSN